MEALMILGGIFSLFNAWGNYEAKQKEAEALRRKAAADEAQAKEYLERQTINENIQFKKGMMEISSFNVAKGGGQAGAMADAISVLNENLSLSRRDAEYNAAMIRAGAKERLRQAEDVSSAGTISAIGSILGGVSSLGSTYMNYKRGEAQNFVNKEPTYNPAGWTLDNPSAWR